MKQTEREEQATTARLRLLLADDHPVVRAGLKTLLSAESDFTVIAEAETGLAALDLAVALDPDLILMDVSLPELSGAEATRKIKSVRPDIQILALSVHEEVSFARMLLDAGATGYALKRSACDELVRAVRTVAAGRTYVDPVLAGHLMRVGQHRSSPAGTAPVALSDRETEVVLLLAKGLTMKEMASQLGLSPRTLETYRARALDKLELKTRADLVRYALRCGWLGSH